MARHLSSPRPAAGRRTRLLLTASLLLVLAGATGLGVALALPPAPRDAASGTPGPAPAEVVRHTDWVEVLNRLDARRAQAFAAGDPAALAHVYVEGSTALQTDRRLLRRYVEAGVRVTGLRMRVVDVRLLDAGRSHAVLRVRDRVSAARARDADGSSWALRDDNWSRHRIHLERGVRGWRIAQLELLG